MDAFFEKVNSDFQKAVSSIDRFYESSYNQYILDKNNIDTLVVENSYDIDEVSYLYEEVETAFLEKREKTIKLITESVDKFNESAKKKLDDLFSDSSDIKSYEKEIKTNPFMRKGEIKIKDTRSKIDLCKTYASDINSLALKCKSGNCELTDKLESMKSEYSSKMKELEDDEKLVSISEAFNIWKDLSKEDRSKVTDLCNKCVEKTGSGNVGLVKFARTVVNDYVSAIYNMIESISTNMKSYAKSIGGKDEMKTNEVKTEGVENDIMPLSEGMSFDTGFNEIFEDLMESVESYDFEEPEIFTEEAKFTILPKFGKLTKRYPELGEAESLIKEVNAEIMTDGGDPTPTRCKKIFKCIIAIFDFLWNLESAIALPFCVFIVPIVYYLWDRLLVWLSHEIRFAITESEVMQVRMKVKQLIKDTDDKKLKEKYKKILERLDESYNNLNNPSKSKTNENETALESVMELSNEDKLAFVNAYLEHAQNTLLVESCKEINQYLENARNESIRDLMEDVIDDHMTNSLPDIELY